MKALFAAALAAGTAVPAFAAEPSFPAWSKKCELAYAGALVGTLSHTTGVDYALNLELAIKFNPNSGTLIRDEIMAGRLDRYAFLDATFAGFDTGLAVEIVCAAKAAPQGFSSIRQRRCSVTAEF